MLSTDGKYHDLRGMANIGPGWPRIVFTGNGTLLFYGSSNELAATGRLAVDGSFAQTGSYTFGPGWTHLTPVGRTGILFCAEAGR